MEEKNIFNDHMTLHPLVKIIGLGNTSYILNELKSKYGRIISIDKFDGNRVLSFNGEVMGIFIVDGYFNGLSEAVSVFADKVQLLLVFSTQEVTFPKGVDSLMVGNTTELYSGIRAILDNLQLPNQISIDFYDICKILRNSGKFNVLSIEQEGESPITTAVPKIDQWYKGMNGNKLLINFVHNPNNETQLMMDDFSSLSEWVEILTQKIDIVWGISFADSMRRESIRIDIITTYNELKS